MLFSNMATSNDCFEVVSVKFKNDVNLTTQKQLMTKLNTIVKSFSGFKSRDYYYSDENERWLDFVVWTDLESAKTASEQVMRNSDAGAIFSQMDESSMIFAHYNREGGVEK